jgi:hypothetical protein
MRSKTARNNGNLGNGAKDDAPPDFPAKRLELTEAMQADMQTRAMKAKAEIDEVLKRHRCVIMAIPRLGYADQGMYAISAEPIIKALEA